MDRMTRQRAAHNERVGASRWPPALAPVRLRRGVVLRSRRGRGRFGRLRARQPHGWAVQGKVVALSCAGAFVVLKVLATRSAAGQISRVIGVRRVGRRRNGPPDRAGLTEPGDAPLDDVNRPCARQPHDPGGCAVTNGWLMCPSSLRCATLRRIWGIVHERCDRARPPGVLEVRGGSSPYEDRRAVDC